MKNIVAGNWKCNKLMNEAIELMDELKTAVSGLVNTEVLVAPPAPYLSLFGSHDNGDIQLAAQQVGANQEGAHTGEFTAAMLRSAKVESVIVGHSERRASYGETDAAVRLKVQSCLKEGLQVLLCCGEQLEDRELGKHFDWVESQIRHALDGLTPEEMNQLVIAYEPIWAIGTGQTASSSQAQEMHAFIRSILEDLFGKAVADRCRILYGGSCNAENAGELFAQPDVNGGLIGGASLKANTFLAIVQASESQVQ